MALSLDTIELLQREHAAWRLLRAANAPLVLAVVGEVFVEQNVRSMPAGDAAAHLQVMLDELAQDDDQRFPKRAREYLDDWSRPDAGWLRKFYPPGADEPHFDATPAFETAYQWVVGLRRRNFVGTESRLSTVVSLLREIALGTEADPAQRIAQLEAERARIDGQISAIQAGEVVLLSDLSLRERYEQARETAFALLSDFRQVEANFRSLDLELREWIALWGGGKGELLDDIVGARAGIGESDQGRSFAAFWDHLLSAPRREELSALLARVVELGLDDGADGRGLSEIQRAWLDAAGQTQATVRVLSEQLRRFIDDRVWLENRRVAEVLHSIEAHAWRLRDHPPVGGLTSLDDMRATVVLPMERPLYREAQAMAFDAEPVGIAEADLDTASLFAQIEVDAAALARGVAAALRHRDQVPLTDVVAARPLEHGLAEVIAYLGLDSSTFDVVADADRRAEVSWDAGDVQRVAIVPSITYVRRRPLRPAPEPLEEN